MGVGALDPPFLRIAGAEVTSGIAMTCLLGEVLLRGVFTLGIFSYSLQIQSMKEPNL
jgi:hypothetical protein